MKHFKKHFKKIKKETLKKASATLVIVFFAMVMIFQKDGSAGELQFVRNADEAFVHNAAQQRDYLFQDEEGQTVFQGELNPDATTTTDIPTDTIDNLINPDEVTEIIDQQTGQTYSGTIYSGTMATGEQLSTSGSVQTGSLDCITPWNEKINNKDFVLAYEQRKDVNTMCNIEKRVCADGVLGGTFAQRSCKEDVIYEYRKAEPISYNQKVLNIYIQPADPINAGAEFDNEGKINTTEKPTDNRGNTNSPVVTQPEVQQTASGTKLNCTTPRGQKILHGQFTKAYKSPRGFIDLPCEVEIRACVNGQLKGSLTYSKCTFNNTTYADYLTADSPTSNTGFLFFNRIKHLFN